EAFKNSKEAANHEDQEETMEDDDNEPDAGSPVIPIPQSTSSTAKTSSRPTQTLSTPVQSSSAPAQSSSRSTPTQFKSTPAQSSFTYAQFTTPAQFMSSTPFLSAPVNDVDAVVNADRARDILGCMIKLPWDVNKNLSSHIAAHLPVMQLSKFLTSVEQRHLPE
ncbi:unnamed protein product, partial [Porites evermanni]